jgi:hypothetical protein
MSIYLKDRPKHHRFIVLINWEHDQPQCWRADLRHDGGLLIATAAADTPREAVITALDLAAQVNKRVAALPTVKVSAIVRPVPPSAATQPRPKKVSA